MSSSAMILNHLWSKTTDLLTIIAIVVLMGGSAISTTSLNANDDDTTASQSMDDDLNNIRSEKTGQNERHRPFHHNSHGMTIHHIFSLDLSADKGSSLLPISTETSQTVTTFEYYTPRRRRDQPRRPTRRGRGPNSEWFRAKRGEQPLPNLTRRGRGPNSEWFHDRLAERALGRKQRTRRRRPSR